MALTRPCTLADQPVPGRLLVAGLAMALPFSAADFAATPPG